jgi:hypothetical protein
MNVSAHPVFHLPIAILELIVDELASDVSRLGRIFAALRSEAALPSRLSEIIAPTWVTPTFEVIPAAPGKCKHGLREDWCSICTQRNGCVDSRGSAPSYKQSKNRKKDHVTQGADTLWYIVPVCELHFECGHNRCKQNSTHCPRSVRFHAVTPEDVAWSSRQSAFPHSQPMPRTLKNYCVSCTEMVTDGDTVLRETRGMYLPIEHDCRVHAVAWVPTITKNVVVVRPTKFRSDEAAQNHFENKLVTFVGDGAELEVIDSFKYNPRSNHSDRREKELMMWAQRSQVGVVIGPTCLRCTAPIGKRKGAKYCSDDCRKRDFEAKQGEN